MSNEVGQTQFSQKARLWLAPVLTVLLFAIFPLRTFVRPDNPLADPGTGWHLKTGQIILDSGALPQVDLYSFTLPSGTVCVIYEWLFEVLMALIERVGGLPLLTAVCVVIYSLLPVLLYRRMMAAGANIFIALGCALLTHMVWLLHGLVRPHIVTYLFLSFFLLALEKAERSWVDNSGDKTWDYKKYIWMPLLMVPWCNLHPGFCLGIVLVGIYAGVSGVEWLRKRSECLYCRAKFYAALFISVGTASLLNPYGPRLHGVILEVQGLASLTMFQEFARPNYNAGGGMLIYLILLVLFFLVLCRKQKPLAAVECVCLAFFLFFALKHNRHIFTFIMVVGPFFARELSAIVALYMPGFDKAARRIGEQQQMLRGEVWQIAALAFLFMWLSVARPELFRRELAGIHLSRGAMAFIESHIADFQRPFHGTGEAGELIYYFNPRLKVFVDDRADLYGDKFLLGDLAGVQNLTGRWRQVFEKHKLTSAILGADSPVATLLENTPGWERVYEDKKNKLYILRTVMPQPVSCEQPKT